MLANALDPRVLGFAVCAAIFTGVFCGLFPALQGSKADLSAILKENGGRGGPGLHRNRAGEVLIVCQVALSLILLAGSILLIRTFIALRNVDPGIRIHNILTMRMSFAGEKYSTTAAMEDYETRATQRIDSLPGVIAAAPALVLPMQEPMDMPFVIEGRPLAGGERFSGDELWRFVGPHYFKVFGIPLRQGRLFDDRNTGKSHPVAIVSEAFVRKYWPSEEPLGKRIVVGKGMGELEDFSREVVGIVCDTRELGLHRPPVPILYVPDVQLPDR